LYIFCYYIVTLKSKRVKFKNKENFNYDKFDEDDDDIRVKKV